MTGTLAQPNVSKGGMPKLPVDRARVTRFGVEGDTQRNLKYHGGSNRAVCLFSVELYDWLREHGIDLKHGSVGENFTTCGLDLDALNKGDRLRVGECLIELTDVRAPCRSLRKWHGQLDKLMAGAAGGWSKKLK